MSRVVFAFTRLLFQKWLANRILFHLKRCLCLYEYHLNKKIITIKHLRSTKTNPNSPELPWTRTGEWMGFWLTGGPKACLPIPWGYQSAVLVITPNSENTPQLLEPSSWSTNLAHVRDINPANKDTTLLVKVLTPPNYNIQDV